MLQSTRVQQVSLQSLCNSVFLLLQLLVVIVTKVSLAYTKLPWNHFFAVEGEGAVGMGREGGEGGKTGKEKEEVGIG